MKESGPYTLGLFSLVTKNVYAIGFSHFIRNPLHLFDIVNTDGLKLIFKSCALYYIQYIPEDKDAEEEEEFVLYIFSNFFIHQLYICIAHMSKVQPSTTAQNH